MDDRVRERRPRRTRPRNCSRVASAVPWYSSSSWTPAISSPWRVRNSSRSDGSGQSRTTSPSTRVERGPGRSQDRRRVGQLVERVLEVGEIEFAGAARLGDARVVDLDPVGQPGRLDLGARTRRPSPPRTPRRPARAPGNGAPWRSAIVPHRSGRRRPGRHATGRPRAVAARPAPPGRRPRCPARSAARSPSDSDPGRSRIG